MTLQRLESNSDSTQKQTGLKTSVVIALAPIRKLSTPIARHNPRKLDAAYKFKSWGVVKWLFLIIMLFTLVLGLLLGLLVRGQSTPSFRPLPTVASWATIGVEQTPTVSNPNAVIAQDVCPGYTLSSVQKTDRGLTGSLSLNGSACNAYGKDYTNLTLTVYYDTETRLHVTIEDDEKKQYRIPETLVSIPTPASSVSSVQYTFNYTESPFEFWISRSDGELLFDTRGYKLIFETQYLELTTNLENNYNIYGLGETIHSLQLGNNYTRTMWANDEGDPIDANIYGSHPVYFQHKYTNGSSGRNHSTHAVYLRNSNGMDILLRENYLQYRAIGGIFDLYFYTGPSPKDVVQQYVSSIGLPAMQQYWTFGFHQCRWGYNNITALENVVENYKNANIPLETIWTDIDYMYMYRDWTLDPISFTPANFSKFLDNLHSNDQHWVPIHDAAIYHPNPNNASDSEDYFTAGDQQLVFMLNPDNSTYIGAVWPGYTVFPDWLANNTQSWWTEAFRNFSQIANFDGIWLDMNEASSFCVGSCGSSNITQNPVHPPFKLSGEPGNVIYDYPEGFNLTNSTEAAAAASASSSQANLTPTASSSSASSTTSSAMVARATIDPTVENINYPPYAINHHQFPHDLAVHAVSPNATHHDGTREYDIHNIWGHRETVATYNSLADIHQGKRPFIITRSTFPGTGTVAGHWGGDNTSKWAYLYFSIPQALIFQFFGIPMVGPDTCGFNGNSDEELCNRWMQLSAFFPFYRNHNVISANPQEAYVWASVAEASRVAMYIRYSLLPYWYTLFSKASTSGDPVIRALFYEFPDDTSLAEADHQFMVGDGLLVTPVLAQGYTNVSGVFPGTEIWYDWYTYEARQPSGNVTIPAPLGHIPLHIRAGSIFPMQQPGYTTTQCRQNPWSLLAAVNSTGGASGEIYIDDGVSINPTATRSVTLAILGGTLSVTTTGNYSVDQPLGNVTILGVSKPQNVNFSGGSSSWSWSNNTLLVTGFGNGSAWNSGWSLSWK